VDFTIEVERSLRVLDGAVAVFDGGNGVEPQSETVWRQADKYHVPRIAFVNKLDKVGADFQMNLDSMRERLGVTPVPVQWPVGQEDQHKGIVDLIKMQAAMFQDDSLGAKYTWEEIPADLRDKCVELREKLIEACADIDEVIMERFLEGKADEAATAQIYAAVRKATCTFKFVPVLCGSAFKNKGVQLLLDAVVNFLPSPLDIPPVKGTHPKDEAKIEERKADDKEPFAALAFKILNDPFVGNLTFFRVYSGTLTSGTTVMNTARGKRERLGRILRMHANKREELKECEAGNIYAAVGLRDTRTGDTLCDEKHPIVLEKMIFPEPVISIAIEPRTQADLDKLGMSLQKLAQEDPSFRTFTNDETGQTIIAGMGELHLEVLVDRMKREFRVEANVGRPQVAYRETITAVVDRIDYTHKKQTGGSGQFAKVQISMEPLGSGEEAGYEFENKITGGRIPREYIPSVDAGAQEAMEYGVLAGYPMVGIKVTLNDGAYHDVDSSELAFKIAGSMAFKEGAKRAKPVLLEPMMSVEVTTPEDFMGDVIGDLNSRRGQILSMDERSGSRVVTATVPLSEMFGYVGDLRSKTQGRASYSMQFDSYSQVPANVATEIIAKARGE
jgi:elongation factor G